MDASGSVGLPSFEKMRQFVVRLSRSFDIGGQKTRFGIMRFSTNVNVEFKFDDRRYWNESALENKIKSIRYTNGGENILLSFRFTKASLQESFTECLARSI